MSGPFISGRPWRSGGPLILLGLVLAWGVNPIGAGRLSAETGDVAVLPLPGQKIKSGWSVELDYRSVSSNGYRPIRVQASLLPAGRVAKWARTLRIEIKPNSWGNQFTRRVAQFLEVPEGATSGRCTILVPQDTEIHNFHVDIYEDGEKLEDLSTDVGFTMWGGYGWSEARPGILVLDSKAPQYNERADWLTASRKALSAGQRSEVLPDVRPLVKINNLAAFDYSDTSHPSDVTLLDQTKTWPRLELLPPRDLPVRWLEYSTYDVIVISLADLRQVIQEQPLAWAAIRSWVTSGRLLCVHGVGQQFERLQELEVLTGMLPLDRADELPRRGWTAPLSTAFRVDVAGLTTNGQQGMVSYGVMATPFGGTVTVATPTQPAAKTPAQTPDPKDEVNAVELARSLFVWRGWGVGAVVALSSDQPFPGPTYQWNAIFNTVPTNYWMWYQRHGMSMRRSNSGYWTGWIPGIGKAPVGTFLVLISLFVIVIGPFNYFWLRRKKRAYFMLITVPAGAGLVSVVLLLYAIVSDGLGVRARLRSFTWIDQRTGQSSTWSRQTYYAGLTPRGGLKFPLDTSVFPLEPFPARNFEEGGRRDIEWTDDAQQLKTGYLTSRNMVQFMVVRSGSTAARLEVPPNTATGTAPRAVNRLGGSVTGLLYCDDQRDLHWSDGGAEGSELQLTPITLDEARKRLSEIISDSPLEAPEGTENIERNLPWRMRFFFSDVDSQLVSPNVHSSILESHLRYVMTIDRLPPRSYVAAVARSPLVPVGVERYAEAGSLHLVWGQW